ncbi:MAG: hypothetical protein ABIB72_03350 [Candidatus Falkowbacteria bacterium]
MFEKKSVFLSAIYSLMVAMVSSMILLPIFNNFYLLNFNPVKFNSMFSLWSYGFDIKLNSFIFSFSFFLPLFILIFVPKKQWLAWLILIFIPFTMVLVGGSKHLLWFIIFTIVGGLIGWLINLAIKKSKK